MALSVPLSLLQFPGQLFDADGDPLAGGWLQFYTAGTTSPEDVFADVQGDATLPNPVEMDSSGYATVFLGPTLYDVVVYEANLDDPTIPGAELYTIEGVGDPGQIVFAALGNTLAAGSQNVVSGYQVLSTDQLVTVASTGGANPCVIQLPPASDRSSDNNGSGLPLGIKNLGVLPLAVTPDGADTIETLAAVYTVPAAASPLYPTIWMVSDGESAWYILGGIGI
jgi:hypothetical protein